MPELDNAQFFVPLITAIPSMFGENHCLEFEIVHQVLRFSKKLATSLQFGKYLRAAVFVVSSANGTFCLLFPWCSTR